MEELPTGTVTFLFTDMEGSTRLLERLGEAYRDVQQRHDAILRAAIAENEGCEVSTEGDSFFAVFRDAASALRAAAGAQRELAATQWPAAADVRVRMGLHTGAGILGGDSYLGLDVNRASRIAAAAHGAQILISDATRSLVERSLPTGARLRDLGRYHVKGLTEPEHLYQLVLDGLEQDFPPPRTVGGRPNNLPGQLTRFIGRVEESAQIRELLAANRLLTLTATGGTGKTRLALNVAADAVQEFADGVFFVDLSSVDDPELVPASIAAALQVREEAGRPTIESVAEHLREKELLLVLDNFEQVVEAAAVVEALLRAAPEVKLLVTSRVPLRLYGEQRFQVPPLALPDPHHLPDLDALTRLDAVVLFAERAVACNPGFRITAANARAVAEIAARLDGLPLAIELAASRIRLLSPELLLERLEQRLLLAAADRNVPERQRTVRGTIEWSYDLLDPAEQQLFARFAVFSGGAELEALEAVLNPAGELGVDTLDALASLVDNGLVRMTQTRDGAARHAMLETVREYALERLAAGDQEAALRRRLAEYWARALERAAEALAGPEQAAWTRRLELDHDNFRSALSWVLQSGEAELGLRLAAALGDFWRLGSHVREGLDWLGELLALPEAAPRTLARARALSVAGDLHAWIDDPEGYLRFADEALAIYREHGDAARIPEALASLGWAQLQTGRLEAAQVSLAEAREVDLPGVRPRVTADCANGLAVAALFEGRPEAARPLFEEALSAYEELRDTYWVGLTRLMVSQADKQEGKLDAAEARVRSALAAFRELDSLMGTAFALYSFADIAVYRGEFERALRLVAASDSLLEPIGEMPAIATATMGDVGAAARSSLAEEVAERVYAEGRAAELDEAVAYALQDAR